MPIKRLAKSLLKRILNASPKSKTKIMFESNSDFCDNTRAVYNYMIKNGYNKKYELVWCVNNPENFNDINVPNVSFTSFTDKKYIMSYIRHLKTAGFVFFTHTPPPLVPLTNQTVVNLWHGTPLKRLSGYVGAEPRFQYLLSSSDFVSDILRESFRLSPDKILTVGYPRNDLLFEFFNATSPLGINKSDYTKLVLWMPTFRQSTKGKVFDCTPTETGLPLAVTPIILDELNNMLNKKNMFMIIKLHPAQDELAIAKIPYSNIKLLTNTELDQNGIQLYHLVNNCDALLTDYSSIYFDYLLLNRPIGFIIDDIGEYESNRGFVVDNPLDYMPGQHIKDIQGLYCYLNEVYEQKDFYLNTRKHILKLTNKYADNENCKRFLDTIEITNE